MHFGLVAICGMHLHWVVDLGVWRLVDGDPRSFVTVLYGS